MVFVVDTEHRPLDPVHPGGARLLLTQGRAAVLRRYPFTIILKAAMPEAQPETLRLKIDPGSRTTGMAVLNDATGQIVWAAEIAHRGLAIKARMESRASLRRGRRFRKTRYRQPRFLNRRRPEGWLPPSLESRVANVTTWAQRIMRVCPIAAISTELVRFDTQQMQSPEIAGVEYQRGELWGYEVRAYLFEKFKRKCVYCEATDVRLEVEHVVPRSRGGSNRVSNLALACVPCNLAKGNSTAAEFGHPKVASRCKAPLKDAAAVNVTRWALYRRLCAFGLPVEVGTGGRTAYNRSRLNMPRGHWVDAVCVGASTPEQIRHAGIVPFEIKATGHGRRQMCTTDKYGFPIQHRARHRSFMGFRTGDIVRAVIPQGKYAGVEVGRVTIRQRPSFGLNGHDVSPKYLTPLWKADGYEYGGTRGKASVGTSTQVSLEETHGAI